MPGAREIVHKGDPWFNVGKKTFACHFRDRTVMKLEPGHQDLLFEVRPETFQKFPMGPAFWSYVELDDLDEAELADLVLEAWSQIVPKTVSRPVLAARRGG